MNEQSKESGELFDELSQKKEERELLIRMNPDELSEKDRIRLAELENKIAELENLIQI